MTLEAMRPLTPTVRPTPGAPAREPGQVSSAGIQLLVCNGVHVQEATMRKVVTPLVEVDQATRTVRIHSQGLGLTEESRAVGDKALLIEVAARYKRGEGAIKQSYRYLVFNNCTERDGEGCVYAVRLPMGAWTPSDPDICHAWLGRGGLQQGDFVLLPRKTVPPDALEVHRPVRRSFWERAGESMRRFVSEALGEGEAAMDEWTRLIGRHDPVDTRLFRKEQRLFLAAAADTVVKHPEHATLTLPAGVYEVVEDRATSFWRKAID